MMTSPTRSYTVIDFYTPIVCHVIQLEYRTNMVFDDVDANCTVKFFNLQSCDKEIWFRIMYGEVRPYYDVVSISVVEFIDKQRNDNDTMLFSIKLFVENDNDIKLFKQLTRKVPRVWNWNLFAIYLCEVVMKDWNALFDYSNPEKDDSVEDISKINMLYKESTSKLIFDSYSYVAQSIVNGGESDDCVY